MMIHTEETFEVGHIESDPFGVIYMKNKGYVPMPPFQVLEKVTKEDYIKYVIETYGEDYLPSDNVDTYNFYRISVD